MILTPILLLFQVGNTELSVSASAPLLQPMYSLHHLSCLVNPSDASSGTGSVVPVNVVQQIPPAQSIPASYSSSQSLGNMAAVPMQNIPNFQPSMNSFITQQTAQLQEVPSFVPQVQQQNPVMSGLPVTAATDAPLANVTDTNFVTVRVSQCSSVVDILSSSAPLSDSVVKSTSAVKTQSSYSQQPLPPSSITDPVHHPSSQSISKSTQQPQGYQQNYQLPNLAQQQSVMENFQQPNPPTESLSVLSHSPSPQTKTLEVSITTQYHSQPSIPQHELQMAATSDSTAPTLGSQMTSGDISNVSFQQDVAHNSSCNQASFDSNMVSKPNANANTNLVQPVTLTIPYASRQQSSNAHTLKQCQFSEVEPLPLQQTAPVILLQQPSPTAYVITGDTFPVHENYTLNSSSVLQYHLQQHMSGFRPTSNENFTLSPVVTPLITPNPPSTPILGAHNTLPVLNLQSQIPTENVQCVSKTSQILQNVEQTCTVNQMKILQAEQNQCQGSVCSGKGDRTVNYQTPESSVTVPGSQRYQSVTDISHINDQLINIQIIEPPQHHQKFDALKEQQMLYSLSAETENINKVMDIHHLAHKAIHSTGEMPEASLCSEEQNVTIALDEQTCVNHEVSSTKPTQPVHTQDEICECSKKDQEEIGTQTTPSLDCESAVVNSSMNKETDTDNSIRCSILGGTGEPMQTSEVEQMMQNLTLSSSLSDEMAAQGNMQDHRRNSSQMSSVQGSPAKSTIKVEDAFFFSRSWNLVKIELQ